ncbi:MFS transporter [Paenibacillus elgii]|uniref:MFS transporter n=1 Tax=Paenibacillus elgii TaxID=189691 RepID=UPI000FD65840|nr:MFS transporter [Paenibacillus elgii]NEN82983.1 MFS transporter [Paenibacillus elgii]
MDQVLRKIAMDKDVLPLAFILFLVEFVRGAYLVSFLPTYATGILGLSVAVVGAAVSVHYVSDTAIKCLAGYLLDRFSLRLILHSGLFVSLLGLLAMYYFHQAWVLIAAAAVFGIGVSPVWLVCLSKIKEENRASQMGILYTIWLVGLGSGPVVINFLIDKGYRLSFWLMVGLWALGWVLALRLKNEVSSKQNYIPLKRQAELLWERMKTMKPLLPGMILQTAAAGMLVPILPSFAANTLGVSHSGYSLILMAGGALTVLFLIPMGKWSDRLGRKWFLIFGFAAMAAALFLLTRVTTLSAAVLIAAVLGFAYSAVLPAWNALLADYVPKNQQGLGWGLFSSVEGIGVAIGPVIGGWLAAAFHESAAVLTSAALLGGIALFYCFVPVERVMEHG